MGNLANPLPAVVFTAIKLSAPFNSLGTRHINATLGAAHHVLHVSLPSRKGLIIPHSRRFPVIRSFQGWKGMLCDPPDQESPQ